MDDFQKDDPSIDEWGRRGKGSSPTPCLFVRWETGGISGGNCYSDSDPQPYTTSNVPEELLSLDVILEAIKPDLSFIQYKRLVGALVKSGSYRVSEYYGNRMDWAYKKVDLRELYEYLKTKEWI